MARVVVDLELIRTVARIRELTAKGYRLTQIEKLIGWSTQRIWAVQNGDNHAKTSLPINELDLHLPVNPLALCRRCGLTGRIFTKANLCIVCDLRELAKIGLVVISDRSKGEDE